jgi:urease gamma subunit
VAKARNFRSYSQPKGLFIVKRISIESAQPGQILAQKLQRGDGVLLAGQGAEVTEGLLRMLSRMNIETIFIEEDNQMTPEEVEEAFSKREAEVTARFVRVEDQPIMNALKKSLIAKAKKERDEALAAMQPKAPEGEGK